MQLMIASMLQRVPPRLFRWANYVLLPAFAITSVLTGTLFGLLITSLLTYCAVASFTTVRPFSGGELLIWFSALSGETQTGVATALITVLGFFIAFRTSQAAWIQQARLTRLHAIADEIDDFFSITSAALIDMAVWAERLVEAIDELDSLPPHERGNSLSRIRAVIDSRADFEEARNEIRRRVVSCHRFEGRYTMLLIPLGGTITSLRRCADALSSVGKYMWISIPHDVPVNWQLADLDQYLDLTKWRSLAQRLDEERETISANSGLLRGALLSSLIDRGPMTAIGMAGVLLSPQADDALRAMQPKRRDG
jgi:hypothetical protein